MITPIGLGISAIRNQLQNNRLQSGTAPAGHPLPQARDQGGESRRALKGRPQAFMPRLRWKYDQVIARPQLGHVTVIGSASRHLRLE